MALDPRLKIKGQRGSFIAQYLDDVREEIVVQTQAGNAEREDVYLTVARGLVLCFGYENPLSNETPDMKYWGLKLTDIPAAKDMPALPLDEAIKRDAVIAGLVQRVRNYMKNLRHRAKVTQGQTASLDQRRIDRVINAFAPAPKPAKALDVYQKSFKKYYMPDFEKMWKEKEDAAEGNAALLKRLADVRGGQERVFASQRWGKAPGKVVEEVEKERYVLHRVQCDRYNALWGSPPEKPPNSRAWIMPEAGAFFQSILNWSAVRFGVAMELTIAGQTDKGVPEARSLFASGERKEGAPALDAFAASTTKETKIVLMQYVRDMLTGNVPKDVTPRVPGDGSVGEAGLEVGKEFKEVRLQRDLSSYCERTLTTAWKELADHPMTLMDADDADKWSLSQESASNGAFPGAAVLARRAGGTASASGSRGPSRLDEPATASRRLTIDMDKEEGVDLNLHPDPDSGDALLLSDIMDVDDDAELGNGRDVGASTGRWKGKGKAVEGGSTHQGRWDVAEEDLFDAEDEDLEQLQRADDDDDGEQYATPVAQAGSRGGLKDPFANTYEGDGFAMGGQDQWTRNSTPDTRGSSPETTTSVYSERLGELLVGANTAPSVSDDDGTASDAFNFWEDENADADVEALLSGMFVNRQQQATKAKTPRTHLLAGIKGRGGGSRRKQPTVQDKDKVDAAEGAGAGKDGVDSSRSNEGHSRRAGSSNGTKKVKRGGSSRGQHKASSSGAQSLGTQSSRGSTAANALNAARVISTAKAVAARLEGGMREVDAASRDDREASFSPPPTISEPRRVRKMRVTSPEEQPDDRMPVANTADAEREVGDDRENRWAENDVAGMNGWIRDHVAGGGKDEFGAAWNAYISTNGADGKARRTRLAEAMRDLPVNMHLSHAELVDSMEELLRQDKTWDVGAGGHLSSTGRPKEVTSMTKKRGGVFSTPLPKGWGRQMATWWLALQPAERGRAVTIGELLPPQPDMAWGALASSQGYKGVFLLAWCMMHWAWTSEDLALWQSVADDMAAAFKVILVSRGKHTAGSAASTAATAAETSRAKRTVAPIDTGEGQNQRKRLRR
ncbi:unnamed protein product [Peniophora sp. CBMAI 1063]|nr:unnamed protein product [Peniophora sp. CBMAI 1063]